MKTEKGKQMGFALLNRIIPGLLVSALLAIFATSANAQQTKPNILIILADDLEKERGR